MSDDDDMRDFVRALFGESDAEQEEATEPTPNPAAGNHVPREGNNPTAPTDDQDLREFTAALWGRALND